jgi:hypothetical protein
VRDKEKILKTPIEEKKVTKRVFQFTWHQTPPSTEEQYEIYTELKGKTANWKYCHEQNYSLEMKERSRHPKTKQCVISSSQFFLLDPTCSWWLPLSFLFCCMRIYLNQICLIWNTKGSSSNW